MWEIFEKLLHLAQNSLNGLFILATFFFHGGPVFLLKCHQNPHFFVLLRFILGYLSVGFVQLLFVHHVHILDLIPDLVVLDEVVLDVDVHFLLWGHERLEYLAFVDVDVDQGCEDASVLQTRDVLLSVVAVQFGQVDFIFGQCQLLVPELSHFSVVGSHFLWQ